MDVSYSKIRTFRQCTQQYHYRYVEKIKRKTKPRALFYGSAIHDALEEYHRQGTYESTVSTYLTQYDKMFPEERQELGNFPQDFPQILQNYVRHWRDDELEYEQVESKLTQVEIMEGIQLGGKIDAIVRDPAGKRWILERKSYSGSGPTEHERNFSLQGLIYLFLVRSSGVRVSGILWDYVRTKAPVKPEVLKTGGLSKRMTIDTNFGTYLRAIKEHGLDRADYEDILEHLKTTTREAFFRRVKHAPPKALIHNSIEGVKQDIILMAEERPPTRNFSFLCKSCEFRELCYAEAADLDHDFLRRNFYEENTHETEKTKSK